MKVVDEVDPLPHIFHVLPTSFACSLCSYLNKGGVSQVTNLTKVWRLDSECEERSTFHCNRDNEEWYPRREEYRRELEKNNQKYIVDLQRMIN